MANWLRDARVVAAENGMCTTCRCRVPSQGNRTCDVCLENALRYKMERKARTFCIDCAAFGFHRSMCTRAA
jgi:hypothetical protein